jgi:protein-disulfide isomerase
VLALLGLIGFGISIYALALHLKGAAGAAAGLGCDINDLFSCSNVLVGDYGAFLGIPLGGYGMAFFVVLIVTALLPLFTAASKAWHTRLQLGITSIGAAVSVGLAVFSAVVIKSICVVCSAVHVTCIVAFLLALVAYVRNTDKTLYTEGNPFMKWLSSSLAAAVPALLAGLIAPMIAPQILKGDDAKAPALDMTKEAAPEALLSVARSRYVGKGEDFRKGNDDAKVVVQMFSDFQCPHCKVTAESIEAAIKKVGSDKVLFVYRNYPISNMCNASIGGAGNSKSCFFAEAARCAGQQGKFWEMKAWAFGFIGMDPAQIAAGASTEAATKHAAASGLDPKVFEACLASDSELDKIRDDARIADQLGIKGTPMLYVNNRLYDGPRSPDDLALLFKSLAEAR